MNGILTILGKGIGILAVALFAISTILTLLTLKRARKHTRRGMGIAMGMSLLVWAIYAFFLSPHLSTLWLCLLLAAGFAVGSTVGATAAIRPCETGALMVRPSFWPFTLWTLTVILMQILLLAGQAGMGFGLLLLTLATGVTLGNHTLLLVRSLGQPATVPSTPAFATGTTAGSPPPKFCHQCGTPLEPGVRFCPACGTRVSRP